MSALVGAILYSPAACINSAFIQDVNALNQFVVLQQNPCCVRSQASTTLFALAPKRDVADEPSQQGQDHKLEDALRTSSLSPNRRVLLRSGFMHAAASVSVFAGSSGPALAASSEEDEFLVPSPDYRNRALYWPTGKVAYSLLPLAGTWTPRLTLEQVIVPNQIWTHDQIQGIVNINVPVRQTVVKLSEAAGGGLWVYNPLSPTPQLLEMMDRIVQEQNAPVRHIVLGTVALEHKATLAAFASHFPNATVWIQPGQWSFPVNVPIQNYGLLQHGVRLQQIPRFDSRTTDFYDDSFANTRLTTRPATNPKYQVVTPEWAADFDWEMLGPFAFQSVGGFSETAFFHRETKTLIVTDTAVSVTEEPPPIITTAAPQSLLFHARDSATEDFPSLRRRDIVALNASVSEVFAPQVVLPRDLRQKGWRRMVQFGLIFFPSSIEVDRSVAQAFADASKVPRRLRNLGRDSVPGGKLYPWSYPDPVRDKVSFEALSQRGKLFCPPILTKLILDREPFETLAWVDRIATRFSSMKRVIPSHLNNDVAVSSSTEFYDAFAALRKKRGSTQQAQAGILSEDLSFLQSASDILTKYGVVAPSQV
jgi:Domain of unknown function (DUF4336)